MEPRKRLRIVRKMGITVGVLPIPTHRAINIYYPVDFWTNATFVDKSPSTDIKIYNITATVRNVTPSFIL